MGNRFNFLFNFDWLAKDSKRQAQQLVYSPCRGALRVFCVLVCAFLSSAKVK